jgi:F0F1-type ATP synthase membrane subunit b/b'
MASADELLREAEDAIEGWLCQLDADQGRLLAEARDEAAAIVAEARAEAVRLVDEARQDARRQADGALTEATDEAHRIVADARVEAERILIEAHDESDRQEGGPARRLGQQDVAGVREALDRLRTELSRVVDAAFDAIPAVEATAGAIDDMFAPATEPTVDAAPADAAPVDEADEDGTPEPTTAGTAPPRRRLRRLLHLGR